MGEHGAGSGLARPVALAAAASGVGLWTASLARSAGDVLAMEAVLSGPERARASRFARPELRDRYVVGRATLRAILGAALAIDPADVVISRGHRGRPVVEGVPLDFNVSHTRSTALFAVTRSGRVGVDLEHRDREINAEGIARKFMSAAEQGALRALGAEARRLALLRLWTCKEAMSKATGDALSAPFRMLDVALAPAPALRDGPPPYVPGAWRLYAVDAGDEYVATMALWQAPPRDAPS